MLAWDTRDLPVPTWACLASQVHCEPPFFISHFKSSITIPQDMAVLCPMPDLVEFPNNVWTHSHCPHVTVTPIFLDSSSHLDHDVLQHSNDRLEPWLNNPAIEGFTHVVVNWFTIWTKFKPSSRPMDRICFLQIQPSSWSFCSKLTLVMIKQLLIRCLRNLPKPLLVLLQPMFLQLLPWGKGIREGQESHFASSTVHVSGNEGAWKRLCWKSEI